MITKECGEWIAERRKQMGLSAKRWEVDDGVAK